jgi:glycosyltransferase involved in cell wall biosynthesis
MQLVIVPSEFTKKVFEDTARHYNKFLLANIQVVPEYFDDEVYNNKNITSSVTEIDEISESFVFLCVGHWLSGQIGEDRKNIGGLIHRFFETYKNKKDQPALLLKTSGATYSVMDRMEIESKILQIRDLFPNYRLPNVYLLHGDLTDAEMNALYNHRKVKAFLSFTKAEGFGRPLLEFATTGKPIIAPHYSGQADFLKAEFICALPGGLTPIHETAKNDWLIAEAKWFTVDYGYAGKMMQEVQTNYKKYLENGKRQRFFVNSTFTKQAVASVYEKVLEIVSESVNTLPQAVELKLPQLKKIELPKLQKI